eukprot:gene12492-14663_t
MTPIKPRAPEKFIASQVIKMDEEDLDDLDDEIFRSPEQEHEEKEEEKDQEEEDNEIDDMIYGTQPEQEQHEVKRPSGFRIDSPIILPSDSSSSSSSRSKSHTQSTRNDGENSSGSEAIRPVKSQDEAGEGSHNAGNEEGLEPASLDPWITEAITAERAPREPLVQIIMIIKEQAKDDESSQQEYTRTPRRPQNDDIHFMVSDGKYFTRAIIPLADVNHMMRNLRTYIVDQLVGMVIKLERYMIFPNNSFSDFNIFVKSTSIQSHQRHLTNWGKLHVAHSHQEVASLIRRINPKNYFAMSWPSDYVCEVFGSSNSNPRQYEIMPEECLVSKAAMDALDQSDDDWEPEIWQAPHSPAKPTEQDDGKDEKKDEENIVVDEDEEEEIERSFVNDKDTSTYNLYNNVQSSFDPQQQPSLQTQSDDIDTTTTTTTTAASRKNIGTGSGKDQDNGGKDTMDNFNDDNGDNENDLGGGWTKTKRNRVMRDYDEEQEDLEKFFVASKQPSDVETKQKKQKTSTTTTTTTNTNPFISPAASLPKKQPLPQPHQQQQQQQQTNPKLSQPSPQPQQQQAPKPKQQAKTTPAQQAKKPAPQKKSKQAPIPNPKLSGQSAPLPAPAPAPSKPAKQQQSPRSTTPPTATTTKTTTSKKITKEAPKRTKAQIGDRDTKKSKKTHQPADIDINNNNNNDEQHSNNDHHDDDDLDNKNDSYQQVEDEEDSDDDSIFAYHKQLSRKNKEEVKERTAPVLFTMERYKELLKKYNDVLAESDSDESVDEDEEEDEKGMDRVFQGYNTSLQPESDRVDEADVRSRESNLKQLITETTKGQISCLVCLERVKPVDPIWQCNRCSCLLHLQCTQSWARERLMISALSEACISKGVLPFWAWYVPNHWVVDIIHAQWSAMKVLVRDVHLPAKDLVPVAADENLSMCLVQSRLHPVAQHVTDSVLVESIDALQDVTKVPVRHVPK